MTSTTRIRPDDKRRSQRADQAQAYDALGTTRTNGYVDFGDNVGNEFRDIPAGPQNVCYLFVNPTTNALSSIALEAAPGQSPSASEFSTAQDVAGDDVSASNVSAGTWTFVGVAVVEEDTVRVSASGDGDDVILITRGGVTDRVESSTPEESLVGSQSLSVGSQSEALVKPSSNGVGKDQCEIRIQNTGSETFWVNHSPSPQATTGLKLKPGQSATFEAHTSADDDIALYPDTSNGLTAQATFRE